MNLFLSCEYCRETLPVISSFVCSCASGYGASATEISCLVLAAEETTVHVIENFPSQTPADRFSVSCRNRDGGIEFIFADGKSAGSPPMLQYDPVDINKCPDKLRLQLVKNLCDHLEFRRSGTGFWSIVFFKTIRDFSDGPPEPSLTPSILSGKEVIKVERGTKDDIPALIWLYYNAFGYTYLDYYTPEYFAAKMDNPYHVFHLAKMPSGLVVASQDFGVDSQLTTEICYYGALMTHPDYRNSSAMLRLSRKTELENPPHPDVRLWLVSIVTTHTASQRFAEAFNTTICAIQPSHDVAIKYTGGIESISQRETYLIAWHWVIKYHGETVNIYSVPEHAAIIMRIFSFQMINAEIAVSEFMPSPECRASEMFEAYDGCLTITFESFSSDGDEFSSFLRNKKEKAMAAGAKTVYVRLPAWLPIPEYSSKGMRDNGFFFTGIDPRNASEFYLLYSCLCGADFDFEKIRICDVRSLELLDYVKNEYMKVN